MRPSCGTREKPDEYFFLEMYGSAVVEHLITKASAGFCQWADDQDLAMLPHASPGYPGWDISEQRRLWQLMRSHDEAEVLAKIEVLDSGMLRPKKSLLAAFGITAEVEHVMRLTDLVPCARCPLQGCQYRRVPYQYARSAIEKVHTKQNGRTSKKHIPDPECELYDEQ